MRLNLPLAGEVELSLNSLKVTRTRGITTGLMASAFTTMWIGAPAYLPGAEVDAKMVVAGFMIPFGVGYVSLLLADWRASRDLPRVARTPDEDPTAPVRGDLDEIIEAEDREAAQAWVHATLAPETRSHVYRVIDGEVVR